MEKKKMLPIIIILIVIVIAMIALGFFISFKINYPDFKLDNKNKFIVKTDNIYWSGTINGDEEDIYYQIDFDNSVIYKVIEKHPNAFDDDQTIKKSRQNKKMDEKFKKELSSLLSEVISNETENELEKNRAKTKKSTNDIIDVDIWDFAKIKYYEIIGLNFEKKIYNEDSYERLKTFFKNIEEFK